MERHTKRVVFWGLAAFIGALGATTTVCLLLGESPITMGWLLLSLSGFTGGITGFIEFYSAD